MKNLFVCLAALSLVACVEGKSKGSNPDLVADTSGADSIFKAPEALPTTGSGGGGGGSVSLGNSSTVIADLNPGQRTDLCQKALNALTDALGGRTFSEIFCEINAISIAASFSEEGADFQAVCQDFSNQCASQNIEQEDLSCPWDDDGCEATVGEFEACLNSVIPQFAQLQDITCSNFDANSASQVDDLDFGEETPECKAFNRKCDLNNEPELINNDFNFNSFNNDFNNFGE